MNNSNSALPTSPQPGLSVAFNPKPKTEFNPRQLLGYFPPPSRWSHLAKLLPPTLLGAVAQRVINPVLAASLADSKFDALRECPVAIEVSDLKLRWVMVIRGQAIQALANDSRAEITIKGAATDLLLLASRQQDADTLFFQRRIELTGDTEKGLMLRNHLDQLPWEAMPLGLRVLLSKSAQLAEQAREAYRQRIAPQNRRA